MPHAPAPAAPPLVLVNARLIDPRAGARRAAGFSSRTGASGISGRSVAAAGAPTGARIVDCAATSSRRASSICAPSSASPAPSIARRSRRATPPRRRAASRRSSRRPDTYPAVDDPAVVDFVLRRARDTGRSACCPCAALTKGLRGARDRRIGLLGRGRRRGLLRRPAQRRQRPDDAPRADLRPRFRRARHALSAKIAILPATGVMDEGERAIRLGLAGMPARSRNHHARPRSSPRRADRRALSRGDRLRPPVARAMARARKARVCRSLAASRSTI